jgi:hypothetical protein
MPAAESNGTLQKKKRQRLQENAATAAAESKEDRM